MTITGRIVQNAEISALNNEKTVTNFTVVTNEYYKTKDTGEIKQISTFYECAYWKKSNIAEKLTKGTLVEITGKIGVRAFLNKNNEPVGILTIKVNKIQVHYNPTSNKTEEAEDETPLLAIDETPLFTEEELNMLKTISIKK